MQILFLRKIFKLLLDYEIALVIDRFQFYVINKQINLLGSKKNKT